MVKMAQKAEHEYAGVKCGIMDQFASMFGEKDHLIQLDCRSLEYKSYPFRLEEYDVVLCDTNVKHSLASSEYNLRRQECEEGVEILKKHNAKINSLRDVSMNALMENKNGMSDILFKRCSYVIGEIERVLDSCEKLEKGDLLGFGQNMFKTHAGLSEDYGVSCEELDFLVDHAKTTTHVIGARMMGGGFGGCTINIVHKSATQSFIRDLKDAYQDKFCTEMKSHIVSIEDGTGEINNHS